MSVEAFQLDCGHRPHGIDELYGVTGAAPGCSGPWIKPSDYRVYGMTVHYWKNKDGDTFQLRLPGRDGVFGSADDMTIEPEPQVWSGTLIEQRRRRWATGLITLLAAIALLRWWWLGHRRAGLS